MKYDIHDVVRAAREQGWRIRAVKKGLMFVPPDPTRPPVTWHGTPSDRRADRNFLARMKRSGLRWPWPPAEHAEGRHERT